MNKIHQKRHTNIRGGRRAASAVLTLFLLIVCMLFPDYEVNAASLSVSVSSSSVKIGDTVTLSITVPAGVSATVNVTYSTSVFSFSSASETANANGGTVSMTLGGYGGTDTTTTGTMTFKAKAAGSATFSATAPVAGNQEGDQVSIGGASASVTVANETANSSESSTGNGGTGDDSDKTSNNDSNSNSDNNSKSADNSLSSLTISAGTLTPSFQYNVLNYTAAVDYSVTSVVVSAKASNANATVESVTGGDSLVVGSNKIQIVVKAENGVTATYTITVTRAAEGETVEESPSDEEDEQDDTENCYVVNGVKMYPAAELPEESSEEGFETSEITLWETAYPCLTDTFADGSLHLLYLIDENGENGAFYLVQGSSPYEAFDYVCLRTEASFLVVLPDGDGSVPDGYTMGTYNLEDKGLIDIWFSESDSEFALVYGVNSQGVRGWYRLDLTELTYMRYVEDTVSEEPLEVSTEEPQETDTQDDTQTQQNNRLLIGAVALVIIVLIVIIILVVVLRKARSEDGGEDNLDDEDAFLETEPDEPSGAEKRYDRSVFAGKHTQGEEKISGAENIEERKADTAPSGSEEPKTELPDPEPNEPITEEALPKLDSIADPEPMSAVTTHKDEDDDDLEFIDL